MKLIIFSILLSILVWLGSSSPVDVKNWLITRPKLYRRSPQKYGHVFVKGQSSGGREYNPMLMSRFGPAPTPPPLRKGQYICGNRVCRLQPGQIPSGCDGMCQYAVS